jgi:membrane peptidoglycan carboxypeptidase
MLAGLLKAPSTYAPTTNLQKAQSRAKLVINLMYAQNYITTKERNAALKKPAILSNKIGSQNSGYFVDWVMNTIPSFLTRKTVEDVVIKTTYDSLIQKKAEDALERVLKNNLREDSLAEVAVVILSPNGAVRGMIGGRKKNRVGSFNRAAQAKRQTGSIFKPFVYATALENGYQYNSILEDSPVTISLSDSENWSPQNYSRDYIGKTTLTDSMRLSINTIPVKLSENIGREKIINTARKLGLYNNLKNTPAISLGTSEHTLLEITGAYASILNSGNYIKPYGIKELRLKDSGEPLMRKSPKLEEKILTQETSEQLIYMMYRTIQDGTGTRAKISHLEAAGKTGTTQDQRDAWFIGFTSNYIVGVWLGNDYNKPLKGVTGGGLPAEIWKEIILNISKGSSSEPLPMIRPERQPTIKNGVYTQRYINKKFNIFRSLKNLLKRQ